MRAKKIYESLESILTPKTEEEILSHLEELSPDKLLLKSSQIGFLPGVKRALERGASVHAQDDLALCWASEKGHKDVVELLLKAGANVHAWNDWALRWAVGNGHKEAVELLLKAGAKPNKQIWELAKRKGFLELLKKYGHINESIKDILKPKSQKQIEKELSEQSLTELIEQWENTENIEFLRYALRRGYVLEPYQVEHIFSNFSDKLDDEIKNNMFDSVVEHFPYTIKKDPKDYYMLVDGWYELWELFDNNRELSNDVVRDILDGEESYKYFDISPSDIDLYNFKYALETYEKSTDTKIKIAIKGLKDRLKKLVLESIKDDDKIAEFRKLNTFYDIFSFILDETNDRDLQYAVKNSIAKTYEISNEIEAYDELVNELKNFLGYNRDKNLYENNLLKIPLSKELIFRIYEKSLGGDGINYYPPSYGWSGDPEDHPYEFIDILENELDSL